MLNVGEGKSERREKRGEKRNVSCVGVAKEKQWSHTHTHQKSRLRAVINVRMFESFRTEYCYGTGMVMLVPIVSYNFLSCAWRNTEHSHVSTVSLLHSLIYFGIFLCKLNQFISASRCFISIQ